MIILLTGKPRAGKDTVAAYICEHYPFEHRMLARGVYDICQRCFGMKEKNRDLLIAVGQKMREIDPEVWCNLLWNSTSPKANVIVSDVRFPNEVSFFEQRAWEEKQQPCYLVRVWATLEERAERPGFHAEDDSKDTEGALDGFPAHFELFNSSSLVKLYTQIDTLMHRLGVPRYETKVSYL